MDKLTLQELSAYLPWENKSLIDMPNEHWVNHPVYTSILVSNLGRVKSKDTLITHNYGGKALKKGRILSQRKTDKGYLDCGVTCFGKTKTIRVHKLVAESFIPNPDNKPQVNHLDGNKVNNSVLNLEWNTCAENVRHAWRTGLQKEKTDSLVKEIVSFIKNYLDFRIKVKTPIGIGEVQIDSTVFRIIYENGRRENLIKSIRTWRNDFKLILRNLSNYKEIASPSMNKLNLDLMDQISLQDFASGNCTVEDLPYGVVKDCLKNHIDIFNLIPRGLAVEIKEGV